MPWPSKNSRPRRATLRLKAGYDWILTGEKAKKNPPRVDAKTLQTYAGEYGERKVTFENGSPLLPEDRAEVPARPR